MKYIITFDNDQEFEGAGFGARLHRIQHRVILSLPKSAPETFKFYVSNVATSNILNFLSAYDADPDGVSTALKDYAAEDIAVTMADLNEAIAPSLPDAFKQPLADPGTFITGGAIKPKT